MPHGNPNRLTAFRFPEGLLARLRDAAEHHKQTMTEIAARGIETELDRLDAMTDNSCPHRLPPGAWCKTCGKTKPEEGKR